MILLGIDAGSGNNCGAALYHTKTRIFIKIESMHVIDLLELLDSESSRISGVVLEDPNLDKTTFKTGQNRGISMKFAQDAGKNKAIASIIKEKCHRLSLPVALVAPSTRRRADKAKKPLPNLKMPTKTTHKEFSLMTKCTKRTSEHSRDAGMLVWKLSMAEFRELVVKSKKKAS